ncbi:Na+/H+ antiporter NhaA [Streptomyces sp. HNM0663]|uniref:Na(+)/H(+) antiporter NhaA n=1 Tax=Streptomyces chengmaiensis TaxID=3040919 RepID=A0ABT6HIQ3_9ACTN|nr:Na+/H+ antiporter NhaA [Streptomyces chengmaiensis]MDH2387769.1 Na+/H+ antiporter NhaA [Streptomyces chengmaiensis]
MSRANGSRGLFLRRPERAERMLLADALRTETFGGMLLLAAAAAALIWANSPVSAAYETVRDTHFGIPALGLDLSVAHWASDGLLTIFFFVAGAELKRELVTGDLSRPATAVLPVVAAVCGMAVPALVYGLVAVPTGGTWTGWAVPMATDIAFALGVLAVIDTHLPSALRAFLLTLAVVDDLGAIVIIALFFTASIDFAALAGAAAGLALFYWLHHRRRVHGWYWYLPLALVTWALMYTSGVHATVAGVAMGLMLRVSTRDSSAGDGEPERGTAEHIEHLVRPVSAGLAVPVFALFSAGVPISGESLWQVVSSPEPLGVLIGLAAGKTLGIFIGAYLAVRFSRARLNPDLEWEDVFAISVLGGIGFTVSLLIAELAYPGPGEVDPIKSAVLLGSVAAAVVASVLLKLRNAKYRRLYVEETDAADQGGGEQGEGKQREEDEDAGEGEVR